MHTLARAIPDNFFKSGLIKVSGLLLGTSLFIVCAADASAPPRSCLGELCIGSPVQIVYGSSAGARGTVVGFSADDRRVVVVEQSQGRYLDPEAIAVSVVSRVPCVASICRNDVARFASGAYAGKVGRVIGVDSRSYSATLLSEDESYRTASVRDLIVTEKSENREVVPEARKLSNCSGASPYDSFRGVCLTVDGKTDSVTDVSRTSAL
jgi:ribosomal protein L24